jgi:hypothetical protein
MKHLLKLKLTQLSNSELEKKHSTNSKVAGVVYADV